MNANSRNPAPQAAAVSARKSLTLLQFLGLMAVTGVAVSLAARYFL
jgi:hypothetical protein